MGVRLQSRSLVYMLVVSTAALWILYLFFPITSFGMRLIQKKNFFRANSDWKYLIQTTNCKIADIPPFNDDIEPYFNQKEYYPCRTKALLTYLSTYNGTITLHVNKSSVPSFSATGVSCCYSIVTRNDYDKKDPDSSLTISKCKNFENNVTVEHDVVLVYCYKMNSAVEVYSNIHTIVALKDDIKKKIANVSAKSLSVFLLGIDTMSRLNVIRTMPKTYDFLRKNDWIELKGYTKIGDNTFPNLGALMTGFNESGLYQNCKPWELGKLDECGLVWTNFRKYGYVTGYAEDEAEVQTFNYLKKGFLKPPTDYYFRPYSLAAEQNLKIEKLDGSTFCVGPEPAGERVLNIAQDFALTFKNHPNFGLFWMNSFSHNDVSSATRMDGKFFEAFSNFEKHGVFNESMVFFFSDHGFRFGRFRLTHSGWLEERLPAFFIWLPKWFRDEHPSAYKNLQINSHRLTSPFDIYMTLQDVLVKSGKDFVPRSSDCTKCKSLFEEIDENRTCEDAGILHHWCTCAGYQTVGPTYPIAQDVARFVLEKVMEVITSRGVESRKCAQFSLTKILYCGISELNQDSKEQLMLVILHTVPEAIFEATVSFKVDQAVFKLQGTVSRLDYYGDHSNCVHDGILKKYCYCQSWFDYFINISF